MNAILRMLLALVLLGAVLLLSAFVASFVFGVGFGVRVGNSNVMRAPSLAEMRLVLVPAVIVAVASLILLRRLSRG